MESIIVYGKQGCSKCNVVKSFLEKNNRDFQYIDISILPTAESNKIIDMAIQNGILGLPIVNKNGIYIKDMKEI